MTLVGTPPHLRGVVLNEAIVAAGACVAEHLIRILLAGDNQDGAYVLRAVRGPVHRRGFQRDIVGQVV